MRIRTRYKLFRAIIALAIIVFCVSLYDIFVNDSGWFIPIMIAYAALGLFALILYIGYKPDLDAEPPVVIAAPEPAPLAMAPPVEEVVPMLEHPIQLEGPHSFRCPFCANTFALELTHLEKEHELRMNCPYCSNAIRIPRRPKLSPGGLVDVEHSKREERAVFACGNCGENLRYTAPGTRAEARVRVLACPHCGEAAVNPRVGAAA